MSPRRVPESLTTNLGRLRWLELATDSALQRSRVVVATSRLMLAAIEAGWTQTAVAEAAGLKRTDVQRRLAAVTARGMTGAGLEVERPSKRPAKLSRFAQLTAGPADQRDILTLAEAAEFVGVPRSRVKAWRQAGFLPNCVQLSPSWFLYSRGDLKQLPGWPRLRSS